MISFWFEIGDIVPWEVFSFESSGEKGVGMMDNSRREFVWLALLD